MQMGRRRSQAVSDDEVVNVAFKIEGSLVRQVDSVADKMSSVRPGMLVTRTDVVRMAIHEYVRRQKKGTDQK